jgi:hypothetical protein
MALHRADNRKSLAEAKKQGPDDYALTKARIVQEKFAMAEAKRKAKLKAAAAKEAENLRLATENKVRAAQRYQSFLLRCLIYAYKHTRIDVSKFEWMFKNP